VRARHLRDDRDVPRIALDPDEPRPRSEHGAHASADRPGSDRSRHRITMRRAAASARRRVFAVLLNELRQRGELSSGGYRCRTSASRGSSYSAYRRSPPCSRAARATKRAASLR
jgi:hypothetical protein